MEKVILKKHAVRREESPMGRRAKSLEEGGRAEIRAVEENGVVRAIEVVCTCGDRITIELELPGEARA